MDIPEKEISDQNLKESEEICKGLFNESPLSMVLIDLNGRIIDCNPAQEKIFGWSKKEINGRDFRKISLFHSSYESTALKAFETLLEGKLLEPIEIQMYKKDGSLIWVKLQGNNIKIGNQTLIQVISQDINYLKESELKLKNIINNIPEVIYSYLPDQSNPMVFISKRWQDWTGISPEEYYKDKSLWKKTIHPDDRESTFKNYKNALEHKQEFILEYRVFNKDNSIEIYVRDHGVPVKDIDGNLIRYDGVMTNITDRIKKEQELKESEKKYRELIETSSMGIMEIDIISRKLTYINPKMLEIIGYSREDSLDESIMTKLIYPEDYKKMLSKTGDKELEFRIINKDKKLKWLSSRKFEHYNEKGELNCLRLWLEDITEKKVLEELLLELNSNFLKFGTDFQKNIMILLKTTQKLLNSEVVLYCKEFNKSKKKYLQIISSHDEIFEYDFDFIRDNCFIYSILDIDNDFPQTLVSLTEIKNSEIDPIIGKYKINGYYGKHIKFNSESKSLVCLLYKENPEISEKDQFVLFYISSIIETEERRWESLIKLEKQNVKLNEISKFKSELFTRISHELKTPLMSIKGYMDLLLERYEEDLDVNIHSILNEINDGRERLENIVHSLLEIPQIESGQLKLNKTWGDLMFLINFCVRELKGLFISRKQSVIVNIKENIFTSFDKEKMYEVITNLLTNAIKNTPIKGEIKIGSETGENDITIIVEDNGIGLTSEEKEKLFKQFGKIERYGQGWDIVPEGTGLGLYISKKIVELHEGKIWVDSEGRNKGSKFCFTLPISKF